MEHLCKQEVRPPGSADTVCPRRPRMTQMQHSAKTAHSDYVTLRPWPLTLEVMAPSGWCDSSSSIRIPSLKFVGLAVRKIWGARCVSALMGLMTMTFELWTLKLLCESHQRWGTFLPNLGTLGLWVLKLFTMYATDEQTDGQDRQKQRLLPPYIRAEHKNVYARACAFW